MYIVTGATGLIGNNVVRILLAQGQRVRLLLATGDSNGLSAFDCEKYAGDLCLQSFLLSAIQQGDTVLHCLDAFDVNDTRVAEIFRTNTDITANIAETCIVKQARLVYVSSVYAIAHEDTVESIFEPYDFYGDLLDGAYAQSKALAAHYVLRQAEAGRLNAVVVCPSVAVGEYDFAPSVAGRLIKNYLSGKPVACVPGSVNIADARDVAAGIIAAAQKGRCGKCYLLTGQSITVRQFLDATEKVAQKKRRTVRLPLWMAKLLAYLRVLLRLKQKNAVFTPHTLKLINTPAAYDCTCTEKEIGYTHISAEDAVQNAVHWFMQNGN